MGGTACLTSENAPPLGGLAGTAVRGEGDSRRRLKALASLSFGPGVLLPNGGSSDSRPFLRDEPFLSGTLGTLLCPRRPALDFMSVSSRSAGMAVSFHRGTSVPGNSPHLLQGCFIQPWSLFLFSLSLFFFTKTPIIQILDIADILCLPLISSPGAEMSLPPCTPGSLP